MAMFQTKITEEVKFFRLELRHAVLDVEGHY